MSKYYTHFEIGVNTWRYPLNFTKKFLFFFDHILPFPLMFIMFYLWYRRFDGNGWMASFVLALPFVWGYVVPGIGTNLLKLWRFEGKGRIGNFYWHHGFMYAGPLALLLYTTFGDGPVSTTQIITIILCTGGMQGLLSSQHDIMAVKAGTLIIDNPPGRAGKSAEEIVNYMSPLYFFLLGSMYASGCIYAYGFFVTGKMQTAGGFSYLLLVGLTLMAVVPSVPYLLAIALHNKRNRPSSRLSPDHT